MIDVLDALLEVTLYSAILILGIVAVKVLFHSKISKRMISALWLIVLLRLAMPVTIASPVHLDKLFMKEQPAAADIADTRQQEQTGSTADINPNNVLEIQPSLGSVAANDGQQQAIGNEMPELFVRVKNLLSRINLYALAFLVWLGGMLTVLFINGLNMVVFSRKIRNCVASSDIHVQQALRSAKMTLGFPGNVDIVESIHVSVPMVYGILCHKIILPVNLKNSIDRKKLILIIIHELYHARRRDAAVNFLWLLAKAIHWFNPLVWFAYRMHLDDMELACDEMAAEHLNDLGRFNYSQGLIDIVRLSNGSSSTPAYLSFCNNTKKLKKRVEYLMNPVKKTIRANLATAIIAIVMVIGCFTTACRPTPDIVDDEQGNSVVLTVDEGLKEQVESALASNIDEGIPSSYSSTLEADGVKIIIDAKVNAPVQNLHTVVLSPREITQEFADSFMNYFTGDAPLYARTSGDRTHDSLESEIEMWQNCVINAQNNWNEVKDHDPYHEGTQEETIAYFNSLIENLQEQLENTPEVAEYEQISKELHHPVEEGKDYPEGTEIYIDTSRLVIFGYAEIQNSNISDHMASYSIWISDGLNTLSYNNIRHDVWLRRAESEAIEKTMTMPLEEALAYAQEAIEGLSASNMALCEYSISVAKNRDGELYPYYKLYYIKSINGLSNSYNARGTIFPFKPDIVFGSSDSLIISVDESGVIGLDWLNPTEIKEVQDADVDILDFNEWIDSAQNQLLSQSYISDTDLEIVITDISLSMMNVKEEDNNNSITVPVWNFLGYHYDPNDPESKQKALDDPNSYSYLIINAVHGTVIG